jgi:hypothetical protein
MGLKVANIKRLRDGGGGVVHFCIGDIKKKKKNERPIVVILLGLDYGSINL